MALLFAVLPEGSSLRMSRPWNECLAEHPCRPGLVPLLANLEEVRMTLFTSDAWRSFFIILIGAGLVWAYGIGKLKQHILIAALAVLCL